MSRFAEKYNNEVAPALMQKFGYSSVMQIPKFDKIVINVGCSDAKENSKVIDKVIEEITLIALGANELNLGSVDSALGLYDSGIVTLLASLSVLRHDVSARNDYLALLGRSCDNLAASTLGVTGDNNNGIIFFNMKLFH